MPQPGESMLEMQKAESFCKSMQECIERMGHRSTILEKAGFKTSTNDYEKLGTQFNERHT